MSELVFKKYEYKSSGTWERWLGAHVGRVCAASGMGATTPRKKLDANEKEYNQ